jgi:periplasmic divalent cation tolerance protein
VLIVLTTCPALEAAEALAKQIIEARLGACVQVLPEMTSIYVWEGEVQKEAEYLLLIKTLPEKWDDLREFITTNHSYDVPEIVAVDTLNVSERYRLWLLSALRE